MDRFHFGPPFSGLSGPAPGAAGIHAKACMLRRIVDRQARLHPGVSDDAAEVLLAGDAPR